MSGPEPPAPRTLLERIVAAIAASPGGGELADITREIQALAEERSISPEAAALLVAHRRGVATPELVAEVRAGLEPGAAASDDPVSQSEPPPPG
jgi:hypothetical protein